MKQNKTAEEKQEVIVRSESEDYGAASISYDIKEVKTNKMFRNNLPPLPFDLWFKISSFLRQVSHENDAEAIMSLTLINGTWTPIVWHQQTEGILHVKFDVTTEENIKLMEEIGEGDAEVVKEALNKIHCTIHSHNKAGASQSGDDKDDELTKNGWHVTLGSFDKPNLTSHCRLNIKRDAQFDDDGNKLEKAYQEFAVVPCSIVAERLIIQNGIPDDIKEQLTDNKALKGLLERPSDAEFPDEWMNRVEELPKSSVNRGYIGSNGTVGGWTQDEDDYYQGQEEFNRINGGDNGINPMLPSGPQTLQRLSLHVGPLNEVDVTDVELNALSDLIRNQMDDLMTDLIDDVTDAHALTKAKFDAAYKMAIDSYVYLSITEKELISYLLPTNYQIWQTVLNIRSIDKNKAISQIQKESQTRCEIGKLKLTQVQAKNRIKTKLALLTNAKEPATT